MSWLWVCAFVFYQTLGSGAGNPFTINPQSQNVTEGSMLTLTCSFNHGCYDDIVWYKDGLPIIGSDQYGVSSTTCSLHITSIAKEDQAKYFCYTYDNFYHKGYKSFVAEVIVVGAPDTLFTVSNAIDKGTVSEQMTFGVPESTPSFPLTENVHDSNGNSNGTPTLSAIKPYRTNPVRHTIGLQRTTVGLDPLSRPTINTVDVTNNSSAYIAIGSVCLVATVLSVITVLLLLLRRKSRSVIGKGKSLNKGDKSLGKHEIADRHGDGTDEGQAVNSVDLRATSIVDLYHAVEGSSSIVDVPPNIEAIYTTPDKTKANVGIHITTIKPIQTKHNESIVDFNGVESHDNQGNDQARQVEETPDSESLYAKPNKPKHKNPNELEDMTELIENDIYNYSMGEQPREEGVVRLNELLAESLYARPNKERSDKNV